MFFEELVEELKKAAGILGFQDDGFREQTMTGAVAGGIAFALRSDGSLGPGSIGSGGLGLCWGSHCDSNIHPGRKFP